MMRVLEGAHSILLSGVSGGGRASSRELRLVE